MADEDVVDPTGQGEPTPGKGKGPLLLIGVLLLTLGGGVAAGSSLAGPRVGAALADRAALAAEKEKEAAVTLHLVENLVVNPAGSGGARFLLASIGVEAVSPEVAARLEARDVVVRDAFTLVLSARSVEELTDIGQRPRLAQELLAAAESVAGAGNVLRVLIPQFVIQ